MSLKPGAGLSLRFYFGTIHVLATLLLATGVTVLASLRAEEWAERSLQQSLTQQAWTWAAAIQVDPANPEAEPMIIGVLPAHDVNQLRVAFVTAGRLVYWLAGPAPDEPVSPIQSIASLALSGKAVAREVYSGPWGTEESLYAAVPVMDTAGNVQGALCLEDSIETFESGLRQSRELALWGGLGVASLGLLAHLWLTGRLDGRLRDARILATKVADGNFELRLAERGPSELRDLARQLNRMAEELSHQAQARRTVVANVSHELARPLGGLRLGIDGLRAGVASSPEASEEILVDMTRAIDRLGSLIDDLTLAAMPVSRPVPLKLSALTPGPLLDGMGSRFVREAHVKQIDLALALDPELPSILADEKRLTQILGNLIQNALKFSPAGGNVWIRATAEDGFVLVSVDDEGPGMTPVELQQAFEPFYQGVLGLQSQRGLGLGLSIASQLAVAHGAELTLVNREGGGLSAQLRIPIAR